MARPSTASIYSLTPGGVRFQYLVDTIKSRGVASSSVESIDIIVAWADADDFLAEAVGFTTFDPSLPTLTRTLPLAHPYRDGFFCDEYDLAKTGAYPNREDMNDPLNNNAPVQDWCRYTLTYTRPKFWCRSDAVLASVYGNQEQQRYTTVTEMPRARLRTISGLGYEYLPPGASPAVPGNWKPVPEERQAIPDYQIDVTCLWHQVPIGAVPYTAINACMNTTNSKTIQLISGGRKWQPGELVFTGLGSPYEVFFGADDLPYYSIVYRWTFQTGGWNKYLSRDNATGLPTYLPIRVRGTGLNPDGTPVAPPYFLADHNALFVPSAA